MCAGVLPGRQTEATGAAWRDDASGSHPSSGTASSTCCGSPASLIVVVGHWAVFMVFWEGDTIRGVNALSVIPAIRPVTWIVQVMPLMFFIGGFSNHRSLDRHGGSVQAFLRNRMVRLLGPTAVFIGVWLVLGVVQAAADLPDPDLLRRAADVAALPFWFLGIYLVAVGLAPVMRRLHERYRWWVPGLLGCGALAVDVVSRGLDLGDFGAVNYLFVWLLAHQAGYFYADGTLPARRPPGRRPAGCRPGWRVWRS